MAKDKLSTSVESPEILQGQEMGFWRFLRREGDTVYFSVFAWNGDQYLLRLDCESYLNEPILGRFVDPDTFQCVSSAWPSGNNVFFQWIKWKERELFICWPGDRGGIKHHKDWYNQKYWQKTSNQLHQYLEFIRKCLNIRGKGYLPKSA